MRQDEGRESLNRQMTREALEELASVLNPQTSRFFFPREGTALLQAAGAVGRALGIIINPPAKSENLQGLKDPLEAIAQASFIRTRRVLLRSNWWQRDCGPLIAYTQKDNRPVALLPNGAAQYRMFDPELRTLISVNSETAEQLAPFGYTFYRPLPSKSLGALELVQFALRGHSRELLTILFTGVIGALMEMAIPQATRLLIDDAIPDADRGLLVQVGLGLLAVSFGVATFELTRAFAVLRLETKAIFDTQAAFWDRLLRLKTSFFRKYSTGDLQNRVSAIASIHDRLSGTVMVVLFDSIFSLLNLGLLFAYSFQLAWIALALTAVSSAVTVVFGIVTRHKMRPLQELGGEIFGLTVQLISGISKLRIAGAEERAFACWAKKYTQMAKLVLSAQFIEDVLALFNTVLPAIGSLILFSLAEFSIGKSPGQGGAGLSTGTFLAFNAAFGTLLGGATRLSDTIIDLQEVFVLWERAQPILQATPEVDTRKADPGLLEGYVKLDRVTFRYRENDPAILRGLTIEANPGDFVAIVGPSGSGKSTTIRLLLGFETPEEGKILYDGRNLSELNVLAVRRQLGVVLQNARVNGASIFENISGNASIALPEAWEAARMAGLAEDIEAMPMGMQTVISEGGLNLSGGQRQRLLIARSLALKPKILIFDEATSALDNSTQAIVAESLEQLAVTRIVVAHRLSTIRHADRIYVVDKGRIVQEGSFDELAAREGLFATLMARQVGDG